MSKALGWSSIGTGGVCIIEGVIIGGYVRGHVIIVDVVFGAGDVGSIFMGVVDKGVGIGDNRYVIGRIFEAGMVVWAGVGRSTVTNGISADVGFSFGGIV